MVGLTALKPDERRTVLVGSGLLFVVFAAYALLETSRDAMFLIEASAAMLPRAYLAMALAILGVAWLTERTFRSMERRTVLAGSLVTSAAGTAVFGWLLWEPSTAIVGVLYIWVGLVITFVVVQVWLAIDETVTVSQAKRVYGLIGGSGLLGATLGSLAAERLLTVFDVRWLVDGAVLLFAIATPLPLLLRLASDRPSRRSTRSKERILPLLRTEPYLRSLLAVAVCLSVIATLVDFLFKNAVTTNLPAQQLPVFFARFYLARAQIRLGALGCFGGLSAVG